MTNRGVSSTIPKANYKVRSGTLATHRARRKPEWANRKLNLCLFVFFFDSQGFVQINSRLKDKPLINSSIVSSLNDSEKGFIVFGQRLRTTGCCITTTLSVTLPSPWTNVWSKRLFQRFRSPHTRLIWVPVNSSFYRNSNSTTKVVILELWTTSQRSWQSSWWHFHMTTSSTATGRGSNVSGGMWLPKGTILKGIVLICSSVVNKKKFFAPVLLLFRHTLYSLDVHSIIISFQALTLNNLSVTFWSLVEQI